MQPTAFTERRERRRLLAVALPTLLAATAAALIVHSPSSWAQGMAASAPAAGGEAALVLAFTRFQQARPDQPDAIDDSALRFQQLSAAAPADPVLRAYYGAATAMRATTTVLPWRKMGYAEDGLALIDKALAQLDASHDAPLHRGVSGTLETRFTAASTFLSMPGMFNRKERGRKLLEQVLGSPQFETSPAPFRATVWLGAAKQAEADQQPAQARQLYEKVVASGAPQAAIARERLAKVQ